MYFSLRRYVWVVDLIGIIVGAGLAGHAVATRVAGALPTEMPPPSRHVHPTALPAAPTVKASLVPAPMTRLGALKRVRKLGPHCYEVPPGFIGQFAGIRPPDPVIAPKVRDGETVGLSVFGVERDSLLAALGLASGDVVLELDGVPLLDPGALLDAYATHKTADRAWIWIERAGQRLRIDYLVSPAFTAPRAPGPGSCRTCCRNRSP